MDVWSIVSLIVSGILLPICGYLAKKVIENSTDIAVLKSKLDSVKEVLKQINQKLD